ncbi:hypothetical protein QZH41_017371, partial [Actinostola sp. cb2023]
ESQVNQVNHMEFYTKSCSIPTTENNEPLQVNIKSGKKIRVCISQALKLLQTSKDKVLIGGSGPTVTKAITTAEIVKRKVKGLHQQNSLFYTKTEDLWEPKEEGSLDQLKVTRNVPSISILLSFQPLDEHVNGYQAPGVSQPLTQFRDEDIQLADEKYEGKSELRQFQGQHKQTDKGKTGARHVRKRYHRTSSKQNTGKLYDKNKLVKNNDKSEEKGGGYHGRQQPSKRPHSDNEHNETPEKSTTS